LANVKSAIKKAKVALRRRQRNSMFKSMIRTSVRRFDEALRSDDPGQAQSALRKAYSVIDKAAEKGVIHKNAAARRKARLSRRLNARAAE